MSIGALIGGIYAAGKLDEFESWVRAISKSDMVNLLDMSWSVDGLVKGDRIIETLVELVGDDSSSDAASRSLGKRVGRFVKELRSSNSAGKTGRLGAYDIADQAFDAMQSTIARHKLAAYPPDIAIEISRNACGTFDFDRAAQIIDLGRRKADDAFTHYSGKKPDPAVLSRND
jgi:predicted acylesterase/phospholipase RssA